jgi:glycerol-3-phosphate dehydrogenase subunit B
MNDLVIVGGGLGGYTAALAAARERPDSAVTVLTRGDEFAHLTGTIDVLGYMADERWPVVTPERRMGELPENHPYTRLGEACVTEALSLFDNVTGDHYAGGETNALLMTPTGRITPTSRYPAGMAGGLVSDTRETLLVGFQELSAFDAYYLADTFDDQLPYTVTGESISLDIALSEPLSESFANALDGDDSDRVRPEDDQPETRKPPEETFDSPLEALVETLREKLDVEHRLGLPAVLGLDDHRHVRETIEEQLSVDVFEIPIGHPHLGGQRLERLLEERLTAHDVTIESVSIDGFEHRGDKIQRIECEQDGESVTYSGHEFVLATGGLETGGLVSDQTGVSEPVFDCYVPHPDDRTEWSVSAPLDDQPFASFGVSVDDQLRPLTERDTPLFANLRAVGPLLGGTNFATQKSRSGVAVVTGYAAGRTAIREG